MIDNSVIDFDVLEAVCRSSVDDLLKGKSYHFEDRGAKILAVAHTDFVDIEYSFGKYRRKDDLDRKDPIIVCPRLDDRLGVYIIQHVLNKVGVDVDILLTNYEERGHSTASLFIPQKEYNWIVGFDRGGVDAVTYSYDEMEEFVSKHYKLGFGSFSDISNMTHLGIGAFNTGIGYHHQHTSQCYAPLSDIIQGLTQFVNFYNEYKDQVFKHDEVSYTGYESLYNTYPVTSHVPSYRKLGGFYNEKWGVDYDRSDTGMYCELCDSAIGSCPKFILNDGSVWCESCVSNYAFVCPTCSGLYSTADSVKVDDDDWVCCTCAQYLGLAGSETEEDKADRLADISRDGILDAGSSSVPSICRTDELIRDEYEKQDCGHCVWPYYGNEYNDAVDDATVLDERFNK